MERLRLPHQAEHERSESEECGKGPCEREIDVRNENEVHEEE
jgi:hypothetical protein